MRIFFNTLTYFGDVVVSSGVLAHLIDRYPDARFTIACGEQPSVLFTEVPRLERLIPITKQPMRLHWWHVWWPAVTKRWDLVVDLKGSAAPYLLAAKRRLVFRPTRDTGGDRTLEWAHLMGLEQLPAPRIWTGARHEGAADRLLGDGRPLLALGPSANWAPKIWPGERFAELAVRLTAADGILPGARIVLLGTEADRELVSGLHENLPEDRMIDLFGKTDLLTAAAVLKRCDFFVGNDSGPHCLSIAAGIPGLGLMGPSRSLFGIDPPPAVAPWAPKAGLVYSTKSFDELTGGPDYDRHTVGNLMGFLSVDAAEEAAVALWRRCEGLDR